MTVEVCPFCGGASSEQFDAREMMMGLRELFRYRRCGSCKSLWLADPPADMSPFYRDDYYSFGGDPKGAEPIRGAYAWTRVLLQLPDFLVQRLAGRRGFPRYLRWLETIDVGLSSRIADVGCGEGDLICQMSRHGFRDLWGYDPFVVRGWDVGNAHLRKQTIGDAEGDFDLIMFNHSLEHVRDPRADLTLASQRLRPGGTILVRIPLANSYADRTFGADWVSLDPPRHVTIPSTSGMLALAPTAGLHVAHVFFDSQPLQFWASEQYQRDIPLHDERGGCPPERLDELKRRSAKLNSEGDGDNAGFVLRRR